MTDIYRSQFKGSQVDNAVDTVLNNNCLIKWGNIITNPLSAQTDLWNELEGKALKTITVNGQPISNNVSLNYTDVNALPNTTKYAKSISISSANAISLKDQDGTVLGSVTVDCYKRSEIDSSAAGKANTSLSNLNSTGEAHFANPSLGNLNSTGEAHFANPSLGNLNTTGYQKIVPTGTIIWFAIGSQPSGYLPCNGGEVSRTTYQALFNLIQGTYGWGNGSTTFNVPNLIDRFPQGGWNVGTYKSAGLPSAGHNHQYAAPSSYGDQTGGNEINHTHSCGSSGYWVTSGATSVNHTHWYAHPSSYTETSSWNGPGGIYGTSNTVQPPALVLLPCIKY